MRCVRVLGGCGAWPEAGRASSGFLVDYDGFRVVLDLGYATLPRLLRYCPDGAVDAVVVTHEHPDHCVDVQALYRVRCFGSERRARLPLYCTAGVPVRIGGLEPNGDLRDAFEISTLPGTYQVGPFRLDTWMLPHHVPNAGVRLSAPDLVVAYTGDTGPDPALAELGADADLFVVDATGQGVPPADEARLNLTAAEAGQWAARAGARRLMLTHFWPGSDRAVSRAEAAEHYAGQILLADEDHLVELSTGLGRI
ncbi:MAG TPA: MBL fold metallo-hydrolase [Mycobacteriales bacterium]|nr:MBL fold metallo-hydrolase [Mycobacteriales bacterium]